VPTPSAAQDQLAVPLCPDGSIGGTAGALLYAGSVDGRRFTLTNTSTSSCQLDGYPGMAVELADGSAVLATKRGANPFSADAGISEVVVPPGGSVSFVASWPTTASPGNQCYRASIVQVTPPNTNYQVFVTVPAFTVCGDFTVPTVTLDH
jgi:hypothetical protein